MYVVTTKRRRIGAAHKLARAVIGPFDGWMAAMDEGRAFERLWANEGGSFEIHALEAPWYATAEASDAVASRATRLSAGRALGEQSPRE